MPRLKRLFRDDDDSPAAEVSAPIPRAKQYVCVEDCYFNLNLWHAGASTGYLRDIEKCPYFEAKEE